MLFELWCCRRLLRVPWTARRSNLSILREISLEYSLDRLMLKLKLQYFGYLMWRTDSFEKTLMPGKIEVRKRRGWQRMGWFFGITNSMDMSWTGSGCWWWTGKPGMLQSMGLKRVRHNRATELNWYVYTHIHTQASLEAQLVKNPPAMQETLVQFLGWKDPLEEG